ncbi:MAG: hypothetical protein A2X63_13500 [Ignavibacteria bacterium GWA2_35_8]|nr:MAG: hypothetical protein A2X63_13500 [Ignavibacteria bacterium GWA2_35_8]OGU94170.1 MAG: hypothetical protein A2220_01545 [Ignavibacteria bacterium RIFOXYA2_FULL_35_10]
MKLYKLLLVNQKNHLYAIFADNGGGYFTGSQHGIYKSIDSGQTWQNVIHLYFYDNCLLTKDNHILYSDNGVWRSKFKLE